MKPIRAVLAGASMALAIVTMSALAQRVEAETSVSGAHVAKDTIVVQVRNGFGIDLDVYVRYQGGTRHRLGIIKTNAVENYKFDWRQGGIWLEVESVFDDRKAVSNGLDAPAGAVLVLEVNGDLEAHLSVIQAE